MSGDARHDLLEIFNAAVVAVNGAARVREALARQPLSAPTYLIAIGKAACAMARGAREALSERIVEGANATSLSRAPRLDPIADALIVTHRGASELLPWPVIEAGHPLPDEASLEAGEKLAAFIARIPEDAPVLVLLSGGASALVESLPPGVSLLDLRALNEWLLASGLDIHAMNAIRKRVSRIKGGRLAQWLQPRPVRCLTLSDVRGDDPRTIASGPLTADTAPLGEEGLPGFVRKMLGVAPPLPRPVDPCFRAVRYEIIATNEDAKRAAAKAALCLGFGAAVEDEFVGGDAAVTGARLAQTLLQSQPGVVHVWGGETTVRLPPAPGRGGRCQTLALAAARELAGRDGVYLFAGGTDGSDGSAGDAGALVDGGTIARGEGEGGDAARALAYADAGTFLELSGDLVQTGPTGTNVMDLMLGLRATRG